MLVMAKIAAIGAFLTRRPPAVKPDAAAQAARVAQL